MAIESDREIEVAQNGQIEVGLGGKGSWEGGGHDV